MKIKICGLSRAEDVLYVNAAKPDYIGFVFAESKRRVAPEFAALLRRELDPSITPVGVFRNAPTRDILTLIARGVINIAQLHGDESEADIRALKTAGATVVKAINVESRADIAAFERGSADYLLLDSGGGAGKVFDWSFVNNVAKPFFLAGGINISNIRKAAELNPFAIDLSGGVETDGVKDKRKIIEIVNAIKLFKKNN